MKNGSPPDDDISANAENDENYTDEDHARSEDKDGLWIHKRKKNLIQIKKNI